MEGIYHFKPLQPAHIGQSPSLVARTLPLKTVWRSAVQLFALWVAQSLPLLPGFCTKSACGNSWACCGFLRFLYLSVCLSESLLGSLLQEHLADVCAICAFSQQVITNCRLTSHSVQLDSLCWLGQGQLQEGER